MSKEENLILFPEVEILAKRLSLEQLGALMLAVMAYRFHEEPYTGDDMMVAIAFDVIANQVERGKAVSKERSRAAHKRWEKNTVPSKPMQTDATDAPVQSHPVPSSPVPSSPIQSSPVQSSVDKNSEDTNCSSKGRVSKGTAVPAHTKKKSFGKFGWVKLSQLEYDALRLELGETELKRCIDYLDESAQSNGNKNRWKDYGIVIRRCSQEGWGKQPYGKSDRPVPTGASGELGEAELRNLQRIMKEEIGFAGTS